MALRASLMLPLALALFLISQTLVPPAAAALSTLVPTRAWHFHSATDTSGVRHFTMNEMTGDGPLALGTNATVQFALAPPYTYGFHILQGNYSLTSVMTAQISTPCQSTQPSWTAAFDYSLTTGSGGVIGSGSATYVFNQWTPFTNLYCQAPITASVLVPIPSAVSLAPREPAYFTMTLLNPDSQHVIIFQLNDGCGFHCGGYPGSVVRVPADYYDSKIWMSPPPELQKLGTAFVVEGSLTSAWNGTMIPSQTVYLAVYPRQYNCATDLPLQSQLQNATATSSLNGEYGISWVPNSIGLYCLQVHWKGSTYFTAAWTEAEMVIVGPAATTLTVQISSALGLFSNAYRIQGTLIGLKGPIAGTDVAVEYCVGTVPEKLSCSVIGSGRTNSLGSYSVEWVPAGTGNFTIRASYDGTVTQEAQQATASLNIQNLYLGPNALTIGPPIAIVGGVGVYTLIKRRRN